MFLERDGSERVSYRVVTPKSHVFYLFTGFLVLYVQRRLYQIFFGEPFYIKETRFTLNLLVQSLFYKGNFAKIFGEYLWLDSN